MQTSLIPLHEFGAFDFKSTARFKSWKDPLYRWNWSSNQNQEIRQITWNAFFQFERLWTSKSNSKSLCSIWLATGLWRNPVPICNDIQGERIVWATPKSSFQSQQGHCKDRCNGTYRSFLYESQSRCFLLWLFLDLCGKGEGCQLKPICQTPSWKVSCIQNGSASGKLMKKNYLLTSVLQALYWLQQVREVGELGLGRQYWYHHYLPVLWSAVDLCSQRVPIVKQSTQHSWSKWCTNWTSELRTNRESRITS